MKLFSATLRAFEARSCSGAKHTPATQNKHSFSMLDKSSNRRLHQKPETRLTWNHCHIPTPGCLPYHGT